jgi:chaperonin GroES
MNQSYETPGYTSSDDPQSQDTKSRKAALEKTLDQKNLAEDLSEEERQKIGIETFEGYDLDLKSKSHWDMQVDEWVKLAAQIRETKSYPWPNASNVKYPLLATGAMQFAARAYPSLVPADGKIVNFKVVGVDPMGQKAAKADKLAKHMNYQLLEDMEGWEEEMDRLLIMLPVVGCLFKKTYFDPIKKKNCSKLVGPKDLVVNYWATSLETAYRKTEIIPMTKNEVQGKINAGLFLDVKLPDPKVDPGFPNKSDVHGNTAPSVADGATPYLILEQHTFLDLDKDGYAEPVIITIEESSRTLLRIIARFDSDGIYENPESGEITCIQPVEYYTKYGFVPNPDGGFYDIGFGHLLGPLNESTNTLINILIDGGHLHTLQSGFIGKGLRFKMGETKFGPNEWKVVNATGDDIKKQIFPLPTKEPSSVLFELLGRLIESGKELASVAEIFTGKMPGQNTPATTTQIATEQGLKVFTAIYKRVWRAYKKEFLKIFRLNSIYDENFQKAQLILDEPISKEDYDRVSYDVCPTADPAAVSTTQKEQKARMLLEIMPLGTLNPLEVTKRVLESQEQPNMEALMQGAPGPQPDPKVMAMQEKSKMEREKHQMDMKAKEMELQFAQIEAMMDMKFEKQMAEMKMQLEKMKFNQQAEHQVRQSQLDQMTGQMDMQNQAKEHQMKLQQGEQQHQLGMKHMKEQASAKAEAQRVSGVGNASSNSGGKGGDGKKSTGSGGGSSSKQK